MLGIAVLVIWVLGRSGDESGGVAAKMREAGCSFATYPAVLNKSDHSDVPSAETRPKAWNSLPPTTGPHFGETAIWGFYEEPVPPARSLHNLEHGGVTIHYGPRVPRETLSELRDFYDDDPNGLIAAPLPELGKQIALSAWYIPDNRVTEAGFRGEGQQAKCTTFDRGAYEEFIDTFRYKGPERQDPGTMAPGGT